MNSPGIWHEPEATEGFRRFCFSEAGVCFQTIYNLVMVLLTLGVIAYELVFLRNTSPPLWYMLVDIGIVTVLFLEVVVQFAIGSGADVVRYFKQSGNKFDFAVAVFSIAALFLYLLENTNFASDAQTAMLALRITRDVIRTARIVYFLKELGSNIIDFRRLRSGAASSGTGATSASQHFRSTSPLIPSLPRPFQHPSGPHDRLLEYSDDTDTDTSTSNKRPQLRQSQQPRYIPPSSLSDTGVGGHTGETNVIDVDIVADETDEEHDDTGHYDDGSHSHPQVQSHSRHARSSNRTSTSRSGSPVNVSPSGTLQQRPSLVHTHALFVQVQAQSNTNRSSPSSHQTSSPKSLPTTSNARAFHRQKRNRSTRPRSNSDSEPVSAVP